MTLPTLLLKPVQVGPLTFKNRVMFPPLTTGYEERDGSIGARSFHFYRRLAQGGCAYVVLGDVSPVNTFSPTPKLFCDEQIAGFRELAQALHQYDCKLGLQIFHPEYDVDGIGTMIRRSQQLGREAMEAKQAGRMEEFQTKMQESQETGRIARERLNDDMQHFVSRVTPQELQVIKGKMADCARRAAAAGVDAIEVHGDRLLGSLCSQILNHREDEYGGSLKNRTRYALEVVAAIKEAAPNLMIEYKLPLVTVNADGSLRGKGGLLEEEAVEFAAMLEKAGVDMIQAAQANHTSNAGDTIPPMGTVPYGWVVPIARKIKQRVSIPVAAVGRIITAQDGEQILQEGSSDIIGYGRGLLCDPYLANKAATGEPTRTCLNCNKGCSDALTSRRYVSCVLNAENGDEQTIFIREGEPASGKDKKTIAVVGAGIAGLEAARVAAKRGYHVELYDAADRIGGQLNLAAAPPRKSEILRAVSYYEQLLPTLDVSLHLNTVCTAQMLREADGVIVAVGAQNMVLPVEGADGKQVVSSWDVLGGKVLPSGRCAVLGGGLVGAETAEFLAHRGCQVAIVEMLDKIAAQESASVLPHMMHSFEQFKVEQYTKTKVLSISEGAVHAVNTETEQPVTIPCDWVVMAVGSKPQSFDVGQLEVPVIFAGDCTGEGTDIAWAIRSGYRAANSL